MKRKTPGLDGWTARSFARATRLDPLDAERLLDRSVGDGLLVRISQGDYTFYVPGDLSARLDDLGVRPLEGDALAEREAELREKIARERARRAAKRERGGKR